LEIIVPVSIILYLICYIIFSKKTQVIIIFDDGQIFRVSVINIVGIVINFLRKYNINQIVIKKQASRTNWIACRRLTIPIKYRESEIY